MKKHFEFIEGATPISDCSGLIPDWISNLNDLNRAEAENIIKAQRKYLKKHFNNPKVWFKPNQLKQIHMNMFGKVWTWAGLYRTSVTSN